MVVRPLCCFLILVFVSLLGPVGGDQRVWATHDIQHRYTVLGYIRDQQGKALPDSRVSVTDIPLNQTGTAFTDGNGYYEVLLHLHNENQGDEIVVKAQDTEKKLKASFDPQDRFTERRVEVNFGPVVQAKDGQRWGYFGGIAAVLLAGALISWRFKRKRAKRQKERQGKKFKQAKAR